MSQEKKDLSFYPDMWGGIECTINRVNDSYSDQLLSNGHYTRHSDIDYIARLGIRSLRYPVLWERHQPTRSATVDWTWADQQLNSIRRHGITPIVGLLHHGSGPAYTDLRAPGFPGEFAKYAGLVAARFPWIEYYTPINEPLTTARFSGLYGLWYPHQKDAFPFIKMLLNQVRAIVFAMKAIRAVNPGAKLVQTEDLAEIHSTPLLAYQRDFENHRRWLTFDLLTGSLDAQHPLWDYLIYIGVEEKELLFFIGNPCPPDILGVNYYVTSERFLDENINNYPSHTHGGNGRHRYADIEAVRSVPVAGLDTLLRQTWERYHLPIAITEAHLNCTREEQMRWLKEVYDTACRIKNAGADILAVTAWALLGAYDWDSLLTRSEKQYESGAYELRKNELHLTAVGNLIAALSDGHNYGHPLLEQKGWWHRQPIKDTNNRNSLLLMDSSDRTNQLLQDICGARGIPLLRLPYKNGPDDRVEEMIDSVQAWGLLSIAAEQPEINRLSAICRQQVIPFMNVEAGPAMTEVHLNRQLDLFIDMAIDYDRRSKRIASTLSKRLSTI